jgi:hypothetical protein
MKSVAMKKIGYSIVGSLALGLGFLGIFIPVLPTTPFLLLAAACFVRSSPRLYDWLINHPVFGPYIYNYVTHKAITRQTRTSTIAILWITLGLSILAIGHWHVRVLLFAVGIGVTIHLQMLKTMEDLPKTVSDKSS